VIATSACHCSGKSSRDAQMRSDDNAPSRSDAGQKGRGSGKSQAGICGKRVTTVAQGRPIWHVAEPHYARRRTQNRRVSLQAGFLPDDTRIFRKRPSFLQPATTEDSSVRNRKMSLALKIADSAKVFANGHIDWLSLNLVERNL